jgi:hypothetical protein
MEMHKAELAGKVSVGPLLNTQTHFPLLAVACQAGIQAETEACFYFCS